MSDVLPARAAAPAGAAAAAPATAVANAAEVAASFDDALQADIADCLDPACVGAWHAAGRFGPLAAPPDPLRPVRILQVRRNTSRHRNPYPLTLCYAFDGGDADGEGSADGDGAPAASAVRLYAKLLRRPAPTSTDRSSPAPGTARSAPALPPRRTLGLRASDLQIWCWPDDPSLGQLPSLRDGSAAGAVSDRPVRAVELLRYVPEVRATLAVHLQDDGDEAATVLYAKTFADDRGAAIHARFAHFWRQSLAHPDAPLVARPLGYDAATATVWQARAQGEPFAARLARADVGRRSRTVAFARLARQVAGAMAAIHRGPQALAGSGPGAPARDAAHWRREIERRLRKLDRALPAIADTAARVGDALLAALGQAPSAAVGPLGLIHGDCHPGQLWMHGDRVVWFDFDEFCVGDPLEDLAQFVTKLGDDGPAAAFGDALVAAYAAACADVFDSRRLAWHRALQHLLQASRAFVFQRPAWPQHARAHLGFAQRHLRTFGRH